MQESLGGTDKEIIHTASCEGLEFRACGLALKFRRCSAFVQKTTTHGKSDSFKPVKACKEVDLEV